MRKIPLIVCLLATLTVAQAEEKKKIYKYTDANGVTHYTETKLNDEYQEADLPELSIVPSTPIKQSSAGSQTADEAAQVDPAAVTKFTIIAPVHEENLWGTGGKLTAQVSTLTPAQLENNQVQFIIDGSKKAPADDTTQVFGGIYRGEHTVQALLVNRYTKKVIKKTDTVTFYMHQNSKK